MFGASFMEMFLQMFSGWSNSNRIPVSVKPEGNTLKVICMKDHEGIVNGFLQTNMLPGLGYVVRGVNEKERKGEKK